MSFKAILTIDNKKFNVISFHYGLDRDHDRYGRPTSELLDCIFEIVVEHSKECVLFHKWAYNQHEVKNGSITFMKKDNEDQKYTEIKFEDGYLVKIATTFTNIGELPMKEHFTICARHISYESQGDQVEYDLGWPDQNT